MYYSYPQIVLQEVPGEISLALSISGCRLNCKGCHSSFTFNSTYGEELTNDIMNYLIKKHKHISCILFYGGEWESNRLIELIELINSYSLKVCLYTGLNLNEISHTLLSKLDFIKTGRYIEELGGLGNNTTNQKFIILK